MGKRVVVLASGETERQALPALTRELAAEGDDDERRHDGSEPRAVRRGSSDTMNDHLVLRSRTGFTPPEPARPATMSSSPRPQPTFSSGRYRVQKKLGAGSTGSVYLAHDALRGELVALKIIRADRMLSAAVEKMQEEFRAVATIQHPRIARAFDFGYVDETGFPFYTTEYIRGTPLPPGPPAAGISPREHLQPLLDLLEALVYLHDRSLLHLDIHAGNLIVASDPARGSVLIDLGLTRSFPEPLPSCAGDDPGALPPEIVRGEPPSPQSDLYLVGRLLLYRLSGSSEGESRLPREIPGWGPRSTLDLERIVSKAIQPSPLQRFRSAREFRDALPAVVGETRASDSLVGMEEVTIGRERELETIETSLRDASAGRPGVLVFTGGRGTGKTRLVRECRIRAQLRGLEVLSVEFESETNRANEAVLESCLRRASRTTRWLEPLDARHGGTPDERAQRAAELLFTEGGPPMVLVLDDLHLADPSSRRLAEALCGEARRRRASLSEGRGVLVVATLAGEGAAGSLGVRARELRPLRDAEVRSLLRTVMRPLDFPPRSNGGSWRWPRDRRSGWGRSRGISSGSWDRWESFPRRPSSRRSSRRTTAAISMSS